ncbi:hypothetical protein WICMUC_003494 [Wickerhamomyces mucosus]|uniref:Uncharacterized protein n=1 Tax=Wickerhamomyces mucosus TaxID=1378264 RepID=A0A9P8PKM3_9ASCO|nr:hypothetical protein WICMUC_003494 [Wickerhamomyces mucosus]
MTEDINLMDSIPEQDSTITEIIEVEPTEDLTRHNAIHLRGVDNLSTKNIKDYLNRHISERNVKIEWINDQSLNLIFDGNEEAKESLLLLTKTSDDQDLDETIERTAIDYDESHKDIELTLRIANITDKKVKNASTYSRYYLFNPEDRDEYRREKRSYKDDSKQDSRGIDEFRDREIRRRRRKVEEDNNNDNDNNGDDLFPNLVSSNKFEVNNDNNDSNNDLFSRIGVNYDKDKKISKGRIGSDRIKSNINNNNDDDDDDLFQRL